ncbi:MAG: YfhO family protein [bacterium]
MSKRKLQDKKTLTNKNNINKKNKQFRSFNKSDIWIIVVLLGIIIILFNGIFVFNKIIVSSDFGIWSAKYFANQIRQFSWQKWLPYNHAGGDFTGQPIYPSHLLLLFMPPGFWLGFNYALHVFLLGVFMYFWIRYLGLNQYASIFAAISMMLTNHVVTLVYPGHMGKFDTFAWTPLTFLFLTKGVKERKISSFILAGGFFALQFLGVEVQVAFYLGLCLFLYLIYLLIWDFKENKQISVVIKSTTGFILMALVTAVIAAQVILNFLGYLQTAETAWKKSNNKTNIAAEAKDNAQKQKSAMEEESGLEFNTSWSFPPEEVLTLFMQRPFGDYSGAEGDRAYWGRLGSKTMILKLSDDYLGIIPILFAFVALWFVRKRDILFWVILGIMALLFAFGGYTPIYKYVLLIPGMSKFRDPNKWIFIVAFCFATVTGYGMHWYSTYIMQPKSKDKPRDKKVQILIYILIGICILCILVMVVGLFFKESILTSVLASLSAKGNSVDYTVALTRFNGMLWSWVRMTILLITGIGMLIAGFKWMSRKEYVRYLLIAIIAITALDLGISASRFLQYQDINQQYDLDPITAFLKTDPSYYRVKLYSQDPLLQNLSNFKFKYYEIPAWDIAASRLPKLYNNFLMEISPANFGVFLDVGNVKYMLGNQPLNHPMFRQVYNIGRYYVYQYLGFVPRVFTISKFQIIPDEEKIIETMKNPEFNLRNGIIIESDPGFSSSTSTDYNPNGAEISEYTPNQVTIHTQTNKTCLLVFHDLYTPDWKAYIDSKPTKIYKTDYLMRSVVVSEGSHTVVFRYEPNMIGLYISAFCLLLFAVYLIYLTWHWWKNNQESSKE